jgi:hypothetical protein
VTGVKSELRFNDLNALTWACSRVLLSLPDRHLRVPARAFCCQNMEMLSNGGMNQSALHARARIRALGRKGKEGEYEGKPLGNHGGELTLEIVLSAIPIPLLLQTDKFISAWVEWIEHRRECGRLMRWPTTIRCFTKAMKICELIGAERAIAAIDFSIMMGYRGLFERPQRQKPQSPAKKIDPWDGLR